MVTAVYKSVTAGEKTKKSSDLMTELLIKKLSGRKREHVQVLYSHAHAGECLGQRKTHTQLNRVIFVHSARKSDQVKMQEES